MVPDPWEETLSRPLPSVPGSVVRIDGEERVTSDFLLSTVLQLAPSVVRVSDSKRLATAMKRLGWTGPKPMRMGAAVVRAYWRKRHEASAGCQFKARSGWCERCDSRGTRCIEAAKAAKAAKATKAGKVKGLRP
jgi:hypothetical protein